MRGERQTRAPQHAEKSVETGIDLEARRRVAKELTTVLADTYALYFKTHAFHWNVTGPHFEPLHELFGEQYEDLWEAVDVLAERIRALGFYAPISHQEMMANASIASSSEVPTSRGMIRTLADDNEQAARSLRRAIEAADDADDDATENLLVEQLEAREKAAWMLRAFLE